MKEYISFLEYQKKLKNILSFHLNDKQNYENYIFDTLEYQEYSNLYKESLKNFKNFIQNYPIHDSLELGILYTYFLLPHGIFSVSDHFSYSCEKSLFEPQEMLGSKIISGIGCCRHIAKNLIDILNYCNFTSYYLTTLSISKSELHALVGLYFNDEKFVLDPTNKKIGYFIDEEYIETSDPFNSLNSHIYRSCYYDSRYYRMRDQCMGADDLNSYFSKKSLKEVERIYTIYCDMATLYIKKEKEFQDFKKEETENYQKIYKKMNQFFYYQTEV